MNDTFMAIAFSRYAANGANFRCSSVGDSSGIAETRKVSSADAASGAAIPIAARRIEDQRFILGQLLFTKAHVGALRVRICFTTRLPRRREVRPIRPHAQPRRAPPTLEPAVEASR